MSKERVVGLLLNYLDAMRSIACVRSLLDQGVPHVLIWDNSADGGESAALIQAAFACDARVVVEVSPTNLGFAAGVNRGIRACVQRFDPAWLLVINNDASLRAGAIEILQRAVDEHPQAVVFSMDIAHAGHRQGPLHYQRWTGLQFKRAVTGSFPFASGCCLWIDSARAPVPLFDERFFMYGEDCELGWRLSGQPGAWVHLPQLLVDHEGSASSGLGSPFYEAQMVAAHLLLARKLARNAAETGALTLLRLPTLAARAALRSLRFRSLAPWVALWRGARIAWGGKRG